MGADYSIPIGTAFSGIGSDPDTEDVLTYTLGTK
jgi:hypothetical protein